MNYVVEISAQAKNDLKNIYKYIALDLLSPLTASKQLDWLEAGIKSLDSMPMRYSEYKDEPWKSRGMRIMSINNYVVLYIPNEKTGVVTVIRVMYGGRNIAEQLNNNIEEE